MKYLGQSIDFRHPNGAAALTPTGGISWRIVNNTVTTMIGGITAVILELAEPRVRAGVWNHSTFKQKPLERMVRTGKATMITVYAPADQAKRIIQGVNNMHAHISGTLGDGQIYSASHPDLLDWVQATANFGFMAAYDAYAAPLPLRAKDAAFSESADTGVLFGAKHAPESFATWNEYLDRIRPSLEPSETLQEFLRLAQSALPLPRSTAKLVTKAAIHILPDGMQEKLQLSSFAITDKEMRKVQRLAKLADRILPATPCTQSLKRMNERKLIPLSQWEMERRQT